MIQMVKENQISGTRFGGISPSVLRELSGVYQPFVKAVKEIISNSYDADADDVYLTFYNNFKDLSIKDNGSGMNPIEFIRDYIRIGKSYTKEEYTAKGRPRIGGKGIGFLAPARYCNKLEIKTKKTEITYSYLEVELNGLQDINVSSLFLSGHESVNILNYINIDKITDTNNSLITSEINGFNIKFINPQNNIKVWYKFDSRLIEVSSVLDFERLFTLDSSKSLEQIDNFCDIKIKELDKSQITTSYTEIILKDIKDFVVVDLQKKGKKGARNIESYSGLEQFLWNLSRIIPVKSEINSNIPDDLKQFIQMEIDGESKGYPINVHYSNDEIIYKRLEKNIIKPVNKLNFQDDGDLIKIINIEDSDLVAKGFLIGQSTTIFPAESRGILLRVKGVAIGEPTYFGLDQRLTGSSKVALSQISGEINIYKGTDAIKDINPGREGFYNESEIYKILKELLVGEDSDKINGLIKELIDSIILRSEINASLTNFIKKYEGQRSAILEASGALAELAYIDPDITEKFFQPKRSYELTLAPAVKYKAEGKLSSYEVNIVEGIETDYKVDYLNKQLLLNKNSDIWKRNINISGVNFQIIYKKGKESNLFCEVNPLKEKIFINWDHPMRSTMGDNNYLKHCLATVASDLPQERLNTYMKLITCKI